LEKVKREGGHKAKIMMHSSALRDFIGKKVHVRVRTADGRIVKDVDVKVSEKKYKGYIYGKISISLPTDYAGRK